MKKTKKVNDTIKTNIILSEQLELIKENGENYTQAGITVNPNVSWMKFVLLDDVPNGNKQQIPKEEFNNVIRSGINMPLKVAAGKISEGHAEAFPIGVITNLSIEGNKIIGLAALWASERPEDVNLLKHLYNNKDNLNISWELNYTESESESGIQILRGVSMNAATLVGVPAYEGRTPVLALAQKNKSEVNKKMDTVEISEREYESLKEDINKSKASIADFEKVVGEKDSEIERITAELTAKNKEFEELQEKTVELETFKTEAEAREADALKFKSIKDKFSEAGLEMDDKYFDEKRDMFMAMEDTSIDFFIQELVGFAKKNESSASLNVPNFVKNTKDTLSPKEIGRLLREEKNK